MSIYGELLEAIKIFEKYPHTQALHAEHDQIWAGPPPEIVTAEDTRVLDDLGWIADDDCFSMFT